MCTCPAQDSQESQGNEPTAENIPTASICVNHNTLSPDPLYASIAQSSAMDEGPSILLSNSFDDDDDEDDTDGEEAHQAEGIARDVVHGSDDENGMCLLDVSPQCSLYSGHMRACL